MATKKAGGSSRNGRDSAGRRLGVKKYASENKLEKPKKIIAGIKKKSVISKKK